MQERIRYSIDSLQSGFLTGWYINKDKPMDDKEFFIEINGTTRVPVSANTYREDLKKEKIGDGFHSFSIFIHPFIDFQQESVLAIVSSDGEIVDDNAMSILSSEINYSIKLVKREDLSLIFDLYSSEDEPKESFVSIYNNDKFLCYQGANITGGLTRLHIYPPKALMNDQFNTLTISVKGLDYALWQGDVKFSSVLTPLEHLKSHHNTPKLIGSVAQSQYRYESLKLQLEQNHNIDQIKNISIAHSVLVEGWQKRKNFPNLTLPLFDTPEISIIIPAYNKFELTYHCIASIILSFDSTPFEVILADDCSDDQTIEAEQIIKNINIINNKENLMFLKSCNNAAKQARGKYILFLNNDTEVTSFWLEELLNVLEQENVALVGSKLLNEDGTLQEAGGIVWSSCNPWNVGNGDNPNKPEYNYVREVDYLSGAALCISKSVWQKVDGFSEYLAPAYFEDTDLAFKVRASGYKTKYVPQSAVFHFEGKSHGTALTSGVKKNQVVNSKKFASKWHSTVRNNGAEGKELSLEKDRNITHRILVVDYTIPELNRDAGSYAAIQEIKLMQALGFKVTFAADNLAHLGSLTVELQRMGVEVIHAPFYLSIDELLTARLSEMDAVYMTRYYVAEKFIDKIRQLDSSKPILFNNADLHFLREIRAANLGKETASGRKIAMATRTKELNVCHKADAILCYNSSEHAVISSHLLETEKLHVTPWVLEEKPVGPLYSDRDGVCFLGGFAHLPNTESVEYLVNKVMPLLSEKRPEIKLSIYGSKMPKEFKAFETDNIECIGFAESLDDVFHKHRIFVAPLLSGAGIKGKVLDAIAYNTPCVLTDVAAEGTGLTHGVSCLIAETPEQWVDNIIRLYDDEKLWTRLAENEEIMRKENYSFENGKKIFSKIFASVSIFCD